MTQTVILHESVFDGQMRQLSDTKHDFMLFTIFSYFKNEYGLKWISSKSETHEDVFEIVDSKKATAFLLSINT